MNSFLILSRLQSVTEEVVRLDEALAAIAAEEREACALICEAEANKRDKGICYPEFNATGYGGYYAACIRKRGIARANDA